MRKMKDLTARLNEHKHKHKHKHKKSDDEAIESAAEDVRGELLAFYKSPEGRKAILESPHRELVDRPEELVELIMKTVYGFVEHDKKVRKRENIARTKKAVQKRL